MASLSRWVAFAMIFSLTWSTLFSNQTAFATCMVVPQDKSTVSMRGTIGNCGDTNWELIANIGGYQYDEGEYDGYGVCTGGNKGCNCAQVSPGFKAPTKGISYQRFDNDDGTFTLWWWWNVTNYNGVAEYTSCSSGACKSTGTVESDPTYVANDNGWDEGDFSCVY